MQGLYGHGRVRLREAGPAPDEMLRNATVDVEAAVEILRGHRLCEGLESIQATGGGAHKYRQLIEARLGLELHPCNELDAVVLGIQIECFIRNQIGNPSSQSKFLASHRRHILELLRRTFT